ncbi:MAG: hypothetical protein WD926_01845 [Patescibacteria group bacterium]
MSDTRDREDGFLPEDVGASLAEIYDGAGMTGRSGRAESGVDQPETPDELRPRHFRHLRSDGPVMGYLTNLGARIAADVETAVAGDCIAQARARDRLAIHGVKYGLVRQFDEAYFERVGFYGHQTALKQVADELGGMLTHHAPRDTVALLETLEEIRDAYDTEGRRPSAAAAVSPSSD